MKSQMTGNYMKLQIMFVS